MIQVKKKDRETSESLIRRFSRRIQQSGVLMDARRSRFQTSKKTKIKQRQEAMYKVKIRKEIDKLKKLDRFDEEALRNIKRKMSN